LFRDRNFGLANIAITTVGFAVTSMAFPLMLFAQEVRGFSPTQAALLLAPMAVVSGVLAPFVGRLTDRAHPRWVAGIGMFCFPVALVWLAAVLRPDTPVWALLLPIALLGVANGFLWAPIGTTATRNLPVSQAGAGSGVYNTTRQVGAVLGSAGIAAIMQSRLVALVPGAPDGAGAGGGNLPSELHEGFSTAMAQSLLLPAAVLAAGLVAVLCFTAPAHLRGRQPAPQMPAPVAGD
jgi:MFS family permease